MKIVYLSLTGNVRDFVDDLGIESIEIDVNSQPVDMDDKYILIMPNYDEVINDVIRDFIEHGNNEDNLIGIVSSGDRTFGRDYIWCAKLISKEYDKPILMTFEKKGTNKDLEKFKEEVYILGIAKNEEEN